MRLDAKKRKVEIRVVRNSSRSLLRSFLRRSYYPLLKKKKLLNGRKLLKRGLQRRNMERKGSESLGDDLATRKTRRPLFKGESRSSQRAFGRCWILRREKNQGRLRCGRVRVGSETRSIRSCEQEGNERRGSTR